MLPLVAQTAALPVSSPVVDREVPLAVVAVAVGTANENHARCIPQPVQAVGMKLRSLSSHEMTAPSIVAIVTSPRTAAARMTVVHAGSPYDRNCYKSWRIV
jgi:hypothetical protein